MKKQLLMLATTFATVTFISCSKEKVETNETGINEEIATKPPGGGGNVSISSLNKNLEGLYRFDANLEDQTGKLPDAEPTALDTHGVIYTRDRKGNPNSAILFTGDYGADIHHVPITTNMSIAAWVQYTSPPPSTPPGIPGQVFYFVTSDYGPCFSQQNDNFWGVISSSYTDGFPSGPLDGNWHYLVATYDGNALKFYVDGNYVGNVINPNQFSPYTSTYNIGYYFNWFWKGSLDDLRFYGRTLTATDVQKLYNL